MQNPQPSDGPRSTPRTPAPRPPREDSDRLRLVEYPSNTDDLPTVITTKKPSSRPGAQLNPDDAHALDDLRGRRLGHFELIEPIGSGGMATVLRARDAQLGRPVALKILPPEAAADPENVNRFESEARAAALLDHENIARVYFCGEDQGLHFIAFEFVEGLNLRALLERRGPLPPAEAVHYMLQVATGLAHAATRGVVHRDIKPSNIIITPAGRAKIVDMGLARRTDAPAEGLTQSGVTLGTFDYISPEQALEPRQADTRSDIYSLGCTFYHALTGRPPAPEGTAAKKLHHHQNEQPVDPRELNPAIPDELAAVLGRMMAKDPRDRYQRPEHLVQHLLILARSLEPAGSAAADDPGLLFVDAPLPAPPRRMPALLASGAVMAVALLVALIEVTRPTPPRPGLAFNAVTSTEPGTTQGSEAVTRNSGQVGRSIDSGKAAAPDVLPSAVDPGARVEAATVEELLAIFKKGDPVLRVSLTGGTYILDRPEGEDPSGGLVFEGQRLLLEADPLRPATIRFVANSRGDDLPTKSPAALTVAGRSGQRAEVVLRGIRFECATKGAEQPLAAVAGRDLRRLDIDRCEFHLPELPAGGRPAGAVTLETRPGADAVDVKLGECLFARGTQAVQLLGRGRVQAQNCAFGPHGSLFHLRDTGNATDTLVRLEHCSALLEGGAVVLAEDGAGGRVEAGHCLFSRAPTDGADEISAEVVLVKQTGPRTGAVVFQSLPGADGAPQRNGYHAVALWLDETPVGNPRRAVTVDDARRLIPDGFRDEDALEIPLTPWQAPKPLALLGTDAKAAFAVNLKLARLRLRGSAGVLGVMSNVWGPSYPQPLPEAGSPTDPAIVRTKVVDPARDATDSLQGYYRTLGQALDDARPDDIVLIKHNGPLAVAPLRLDKSDLKLTLKAFPGYQPVLTLAGTAEADPALIRLHEGSLLLEGLQFSLKPVRTDFRSQSVVAVTGGGQCEFRQCVVTLEEVEDVQLAAVALPDPEGVMKMGGDRRGVAHVRFDDCFVRGKGDLLSARGGRRFELELDDSLVALDGALATAAGGAKEPPAGSPALIRLRRTTVAMTEHLLALRLSRDDDRSGPGLPATQVFTSDSLIVALGGRSLVHLDAVDTDEQVRQLVLWGENRQTFYGNVGQVLLDVQPTATDRMPAPTPYDAERWLALTRERAAVKPFVRVKFSAPAADKPLAQSRPGDFRPRFTDADRPVALDGEIGAPVERLPRPAGE
jgi:hypothetical protein